MDWNDVCYHEVKNDALACVLTSSTPSSWHWTVTPQEIKKWIGSNGDSTATTIFTFQQADTRRWDLLKMIDYGVSYV